MSRLIDADKAKEVLTKLLYETALNNSGGASLMCEDIAENRLETWFGLVPTVDAVEVVRCKDCVFFHRYGFKLEYTECRRSDCHATEDGYCCWAERREDVQESD